MKKVIVLLIPRWIKILFFLITMLISFLLFSTPILLIIVDALLPSAFLSSASLRPSSLDLKTLLLSHLNSRHSLIDIPMVSLARSGITLCVYSFCDGPRLSKGPYLAITTVCSAASLVFVSLKASYVFMIIGNNNDYYINNNDARESDNGYVKAMEVAMFASSIVLAIGHVVVAYRTSCRERRKLLVYKIDVEAAHARIDEAV